MFGDAAAIDGETLVVSKNGAVYVYEPDPLTAFWTVVAKLVPSDVLADPAGFGSDVDIDAGVVVVGTSDEGRLYLYEEPADGWLGVVNEDAQLVTFMASSVGGRVAISGDTVVSSPASVGSDAFVWTEPAGGWSNSIGESARLARLAGSSAFFEVAISGDTVAATHLGTLTQQGRTYLFEEPAGGWSGTQNETARLTPSDAQNGDFFGDRLGFDGDTLAAAAPRSADPTGAAVYVFAEPAGGWVSANEDARVVPPDVVPFDPVGLSVDVVGDELAIGNRAAESTHVYVEPSGGWQGAPSPDATLLPADAANALEFGAAVAISPTHVAVGGPRGRQPAAGVGSRLGSAHLFGRPAGGWSGSPLETQKLFAALPDIDGVQQFGSGVAFDGDLAVVGAVGDDEVANNAGAAYVFERQPSGWVLMTKLTASDGAAADSFGGAVALSGDTIAVGADEAGVGDTGAVYVYQLTGGTWSEILTESAVLRASDGASGDEFGKRLALDGETVVVGTEIESGGPGKAYVFVEPGGGWSGSLSETAQLAPSDSSADDGFGAAVGLSGDTAVVTRNGRGYVFEEPAGGWTGSVAEAAQLLPSDFAVDDAFGSSVGIEGDTIVVGALLDDMGGMADVGSAYVFREPALGWSGTVAESAKLGAATPAAGTLFGFGLGLAPGAIAVGRIGGALLYVEPGGGWSGAQTEDLALPEPVPGGNFGIPLSLTATRLLVGESGDDFQGRSLVGAAAEYSLFSEWGFGGEAQGGDVSFAVGGVTLQVLTSAGESASTVAANVAAAINGDPTLAAAGIVASAAGPVVSVNAVVSAAVINDPGLSHTPNVPALALPGLALLGLALGTVGAARIRARRPRERSG